MYLDLNKALSYDKLFTFIIGARGVGKTFASKKHCINRFLKYGEEFIYVRRNKSDLKKINLFFNDIREQFPDHKLEMKNGVMHIDGKVAGYSIPLSTSATQKSTPYPKVGWIIFDEFIIDKGYQRYLPNEVDAFLELYSTIARLRDVKVIFLSNAISVTNPYFTYFHLDITNNREFFTQGEIVVQLVKNEEYANAAKQTRFGKLIAGTDYSAYAVDNAFLRDSNEFIAKRSANSALLFNLHTRSNTYGVWYDSKERVFNVSKDFNPDYNIEYSTDILSHMENTTLITKKHPYLFEQFLTAYLHGKTTFETIQIKNEVLREIKYA